MIDLALGTRFALDVGMADRILVPTDFSEGSQEALRFACKLATALNVGIDLLHAWDRGLYAGAEAVPVHEADGHVATLKTVVQHEAEQLLAKLAVEFATLAPDIRGVLDERNGAEAIVAMSKDYVMVVMSTHGRTGLSRLVLGSVAENVVRKAHCPVVTVRPKTT